jgi:hypothetical protein
MDKNEMRKYLKSFSNKKSKSINKKIKIKYDENYEDNAIIYYNKCHKDILTKDDNIIRLNRAFINYIKHNCTNYNDFINPNMYRKNYKEINQKFLDKIQIVYSELSLECEIQKGLK